MIIAQGRSGELRLGGRIAARLSTWAVGVSDETFRDGRWTCTTSIVTRDAFLFGQANGMFELRLNVGASIYRWRHVQMESEDPLRLTGEGRPEIMPG